MDKHNYCQPGPENQGDIARAQENSAPTKRLKAFQYVHIKKIYTWDFHPIVSVNGKILLSFFLIFPYYIITAFSNLFWHKQFFQREIFFALFSVLVETMHPLQNIGKELGAMVSTQDRAETAVMGTGCANNKYWCL